MGGNESWNKKESDNNQNNSTISRSSSRSGSVTPSNISPHTSMSRSNSSTTSRCNSHDYSNMERRNDHGLSQTDALQIQTNHRLVIQNHTNNSPRRSAHSNSPIRHHTSIPENGDDENGEGDKVSGQGDVDKEIQELEAQLEIAKLEAKLARLRNGKKTVVSAPSVIREALEQDVKVKSYDGDSMSGKGRDGSTSGKDEERERDVRIREDSLSPASSPNSQKNE